MTKNVLLVTTHSDGKTSQAFRVFPTDSVLNTFLENEMQASGVTKIEVYVRDPSLTHSKHTQIKKGD